MKERIPMYEFDLGFIGNVICSADTAVVLMGTIKRASLEASKTQLSGLSNAYRKISDDIYNSLKELGFYDDIL